VNRDLTASFTFFQIPDLFIQPYSRFSSEISYAAEGQENNKIPARIFTSWVNSQDAEKRIGPEKIK
jgi:hypothetical protein